jgi:hypothetical protein
MNPRTVRFDFVLGVGSSVVASLLYAAYFSGRAEQSLTGWLTGNWREILYLSVVVTLATMLAAVNSRRNIPKITINCPGCPTRIENFALLPGNRVLGCVCQRQLRVEISEKLSLNIEPYSAAAGERQGGSN